MRTRIMLAALVTTLVLASSAAAATDERIIFGKDVNAIMEVAKGYGRASLTKDDGGDPQIEAKMNGVGYNIYFYNCTNNANCTSIQFVAAWSKNVKTATPEEVAEWNRSRRFGFAIINKAGLLMLKMDVMLAFGMVEKNLDVYFDVWKSLIGSLQKEVLQK